ncbi:hypothetical protein CANTEDRAFT_92443, partial [Yamadazyma tenuis ATCC 10573]
MSCCSGYRRHTFLKPHIPFLMVFGFKVLSALACIALASAVEITTNTIKRGTISLSVGDYTIDEGVYLSIINNADSAFLGSFTNKGGFYITSDSSLIALTASVYTLTGTIDNSGIWSWNSVESLTTPDFELYAATFQNTGTMFFAGDGSVGIPVMSVLASDWDNEGLIVFSLTTRSTGEVLLGSATDSALSSITNDGTICLINQVYHQSTGIDGSGCFDIGADSSVWLQQSILGSYGVDTDQIFYLSAQDSSIRAESFSSTQTFTVAGFYGTNIIGISSTIYSISYSGDTLRINGGTLLIPQYTDFVIGTGYDSDLFELVTSNFGEVSLSFSSNAVQYTGDLPSGSTSSSSCLACQSLPEVP